MRNMLAIRYRSLYSQLLDGDSWQGLVTNLPILMLTFFQEVQERIKTHVLATDLSYFKYDDFIYVLDLVNR